MPELPPIELSLKRNEITNLFYFVDTSIEDERIAVFDEYLTKHLAKPSVYAYVTTINDERREFHLTRKSDFSFEQWIDYPAYLTWENTFHIRYKRHLEHLGIKHTNPFIHPDDINRVAFKVKQSDFELPLLSEIHQLIKTDKYLSH